MGEELGNYVHQNMGEELGKYVHQNYCMSELSTKGPQNLGLGWLSLHSPLEGDSIRFTYRPTSDSMTVCVVMS